MLCVKHLNHKDPITMTTDVRKTEQDEREEDAQLKAVTKMNKVN